MDKQEAIIVVEKMMKELSMPERTTWVRKDLDHVIDDLLEVWGFLQHTSN